MVHGNAPLSETGRLRLARCVVDDGWPLRRAAERFQVSHTTAARWAARVPAGRRRGPGRQVFPSACQPGPHLPAHPSTGSSACGSAGGWGRPGSPSGSAWHPPPRMRSCAAMAARGWRTWTGPPACQSATRNGTGPASWSTSTSRNSATSPTAAAGACWAGPGAFTTTRPTAAHPGATATTTRSWVTATCTPR